MYILNLFFLPPPLLMTYLLYNVFSPFLRIYRSYRFVIFICQGLSMTKCKINFIMSADVRQTYYLNECNCYFGRNEKDLSTLIVKIKEIKHQIRACYAYNKQFFQGHLTYYPQHHNIHMFQFCPYIPCCHIFNLWQMSSCFFYRIWSTEKLQHRTCCKTLAT